MDPETRKPLKPSRPWLGPVLLVAFSLGTFLIGLLAGSVQERRAEAALGQVRVFSPLGDWETDNAKWGLNFPREYEGWEATRLMSGRTKYGGSAERDHLGENPRLVVMWAGYPFAKDYKAPRGHRWSLEDLRASGRISEKTPATCYTCKSPDAPRLMAELGAGKFYAAKFKEYEKEVGNTIGCRDCHNPKTMRLEINRPAIVEAFKRRGEDVNKSSQQDMRSLVCAQCHSEYYFKGKVENYLTFPWDDGMTIEGMEKYYDKAGHVDWTHAISGAKMVKMQHPDYELFKQGVHSYRNVSCADCHMPYKSEGGVKVTDHQIRSPLENLANSCGVCHRWSEDEIKSRVEGIQDKTKELLTSAEEAVVALHLEIGDAAAAGASEAELERPRDLVRRAQMYWDYVSSANGVGFHAPQESARILGKSLNYAMEGRLAVSALRARRGRYDPPAKPDLASKEKAQAFIKPYVEAASK